MAVEQRFAYRNIGTEAAPVWQAWLVKTVADAVLMSDSASETKTIKDYVDEKIAALIGSATPETLDTLEEIAAWIENHEEVADALNKAIATKADKDHVHAVASADANGFMSKENFTKLAGIEEGANKYVHPATHAASMIVQDADHQFITQSQKDQLTGNITYTNSTPIVSAHGGVAVGETFDKVPIKDLFDKILYPYVAPTLSATCTAPANGGTYEIGVGTTATSVRAVVGKKSRSITKIEVFGSDAASTALATVTAGVANGGTFDIKVSKELKTAALNGFKFTVKVTDSDNKSVSANTGVFNLVYPIYTGVTSESSVSASMVTGLTKKIETKANKRYTYTASNQRIVLAYPASYGNLKIIYDANNFDVTSTFTKSTVNITCADGTSVSYNVYMNDPSTVTDFAMDYRF